MKLYFSLFNISNNINYLIFQVNLLYKNLFVGAALSSSEKNPPKCDFNIYFILFFRGRGTAS